MIYFIGSLDHIFTYLCNVDMNETNRTLQTFVEENIKHHACLIDQIYRRQPFSSISLVHIIASYELMEEIAFDKVLRTYIRTELQDAEWTNDMTFDQFLAQTYDKGDMPEILKSPTVWIGMLKRWLIRVLSANVDLTIAKQFYLERIDLWSNDITEEHLQSIEVEEKFLLRHTYLILYELELRERAVHHVEIIINDTPVIPKTDEQRMSTFTLINPNNGPQRKTTLPRPTPGANGKKLRIK